MRRMYTVVLRKKVEGKMVTVAEDSFLARNTDEALHLGFKRNPTADVCTILRSE